MFVSKYNIKQLDSKIQILANNFSCGNMHIDSFLKSPQALDIGFGQTYVWLEENNDGIIGFYNIGTGSLDQYNNGERYKIGGTIHIAEFALAQKYRGVPAYNGANINLSDILLFDCLDRVEYLRKHFVGFSFVTLQSTPEGEGLYSRNDFEYLEEDMHMSKIQYKEGDCVPMYLALDIE